MTNANVNSWQFRHIIGRLDAFRFFFKKNMTTIANSPGEPSTNPRSVEPDFRNKTCAEEYRSKPESFPTAFEFPHRPNNSQHPTPSLHNHGSTGDSSSGSVKN